MKIAISNIAWNIEENNAIKDLLVQENITAIEVAPTKLWETPTIASSQEISTVKNFWNNSNINIVAMQSLLFGKPNFSIFNEKPLKDEMLVYLSDIIRIGAELGVKPFVFGSPKNRLISPFSQEKYSIAVEFFEQLGEVARKYNTTFCIEPNPKQYGCDFITNTAEAVELIKTVNHPGFQLHLDAAAMTLNEENIGDSIELAAPYLKHFHISAPYLEELSNGQVNHATISKALQGINYNHFISIEMKTVSETNNINIIQKNLRFVKEAYSN